MSIFLSALNLGRSLDSYLPNLLLYQLLGSPLFRQIRVLLNVHNSILSTILKQSSFKVTSHITGNMTYQFELP